MNNAADGDDDDDDDDDDYAISTVIPSWCNFPVYPFS